MSCVDIVSVLLMLLLQLNEQFHLLVEQLVTVVQAGAADVSPLHRSDVRLQWLMNRRCSG